MKTEPLVVACTSDVSGKLRGKGFPEAEFEKRLRRGVGWTPTNVQITCFDVIAESPFGALGDLVLLPDAATRVRVERGEDEGTDQFVLGDIRHTDGQPWTFCTRSLLKGALERLQRVSGAVLFGAFEHEFQFRDAQQGQAYSYADFRRKRRFAEFLTAAMRDAGIVPDTFMKEFGAGQYEVTMKPALGVQIADHSAILKELVSIAAERFGESVTFTPLRDPAGVGNGVHIHLSFRDDKGQPLTYAAEGKHGLSPLAGQFVAGILKYLDGIIALTAPSVVSYGRLTPHRWSAAFNNLGFRDREASVRICPVSDVSDIARADQFNFEFRAADACASPHLALAAIVHAGVQGIEEGLVPPDASSEDLSILPADELRRRGIVRLPQTLEAALQAFGSNAVATGWFPDGFAEVYLKHKRREIEHIAGRSEQEVHAAYEAAY